ncbi:unnamed protein product [Brachionus calyciflorus]|uniref:Uncharacterized protein n=1 Tax=Brachionus calyciflorus TaxID=104777 RepID=A0A813WKT6_9BILA|nr:unnamed protein product [Brachionus calyciflorus]
MKFYLSLLALSLVLCFATTAPSIDQTLIDKLKNNVQNNNINLDQLRNEIKNNFNLDQLRNDIKNNFNLDQLKNFQGTTKTLEELKKYRDILSSQLTDEQRQKYIPKIKEALDELKGKVSNNMIKKLIDNLEAQLAKLI